MCSSDLDGFVANRSRIPFNLEQGLMIEEGALPQQIDKVMEGFGYPVGPFKVNDMSGMDVSYDTRKRRAAANPNYRGLPITDAIVEAGRLGQKTGAGWYRYEAGRRDALADPVVDDIIATERRTLGIKPRKLTDTEIVDRLLYALTNEGAALLGEGIAQRASDIDVVYLAGYGFPVYRGGPMFHAQQQGLFNVVRRMQEFAANPHGDPKFWRPAPLLLRAAAAGSFDAATAKRPRRSRS